MYKTVAITAIFMGLTIGYLCRSEGVVTYHIQSPKPPISTKVHVEPTLTPIPPQNTVVAEIASVFKENAPLFTQIARAESGLRPDAKGWNCHYYRHDGTRYSAACRIEDRSRAWSVDCGVFQHNISGQECPKEYLNPSFNIKKAKEKFDSRGTQPWDSSRHHWISTL